MNFNQQNKQNQRIDRISPDTLVVGTDIAKRNHVARAFDYRGRELAGRKVFQNDESGLLSLLSWIEEIRVKHEKSDVVLGVEPTGHYWFPLFHFLSARDIHVVVVNPHHVKKSKELDDNSPTKNDTKDAKVIAKLVVDGRYSEPRMMKGIYADLRGYMNHYETLLRELQRVKNRVHGWIDRYFPEYHQVFAAWEGKTSFVTLKHVPLPHEVVKMGEKELVKLWRSKGIGKGIGLKKAAELYEKAKNSIGLTDGIRAAQKQIAMLLEQYEMLDRQVTELLGEVTELMEDIPGATEMMSIPGIGLITVAAFLAETGALSDYAHHQQIVRHAGFSLRENSSGKHIGKTSISKRGRSRLRSVVFKAALSLVAKNEQFRAIHQYLKTRPQNPLNGMQSMIALCNKLIRVLFELGTKRKNYDPQKMLGPVRLAQLQSAA